MEPLKRKIGYLKPQAVKKNTESGSITFNAGTLIVKDKNLAEGLRSLPICMKNLTEKESSKKIVTWVKDHPLFKWGAMCAKLKIDKGNFQRTLNSKNPNIKPDIISKIEEVLREYGYQ